MPVVAVTTAFLRHGGGLPDLAAALFSDKRE